MDKDTLLKLADRIGGFDHTRWDHAKIQDLITNRFKLQVLLTCFAKRFESFVPRTDRPTASLTYVDNFPVVEKPATEEQCLSLVSKVLSSVDTSLMMSLDSFQRADADLIFAGLVAAQDEWVRYFATTLMQEGFESGLYEGVPPITGRYKDPLFAIWNSFVPRPDITTLTTTQKLRSLAIVSLQHFVRGANPKPLSSYTVGELLKNEIEERGSFYLRSCGAQVANDVEYLPTHFWKGRRLYFPSDLVLEGTTPEGSLRIPSVCDRNNKAKLPDVQWSVGTSHVEPADAILIWTNEPLS